MFAFKTLQRRLTILLVAPLTLFLLGFGFFGHRFIQGLLFEEWREVAILRLQRAAHQMDMRLHEQMHWMGLFAQAGQDPQGQMIQSWILQQLQAQPGVRLTGREGAPGPEAGPRSAGAFKPGSRASPSR